MTDADEVQVSPRVIAISSGKGGVGKTFFSVHLAVKAVQQGLRVLLLDADLGMGNVDVMLGLASQGTIKQALSGAMTLNDIVVHSKQGFDVLPGGSGFAELTTLTSKHQQVMIDEMREIAKNYDLILIDTAAGIGDNVLFFVASAESSLVVLTPDPTSLTDAYALIKVLSQQRDVHRFMVLVNQTDAFEGELTFRRLLSVADRYLDVQLDYVGCMPRSKDVQKSIQQQKVLMQGEAYGVMDKLLSTILARPRDGSRQGGLQFFWEHSLGQNLHAEADG